MKEVVKFYDEFAKQQYKAGVHKRHLTILSWLKYHGLKPDHDVLEVGCGIGTVTGLIASYLKSGCLVANDISEQSINIAKEKLNEFINVEFLTGNIVDIDIDKKFDVIVLPDVIEHIPIVDHQSFFEQLSIYLKNDGFILIHIPNPYYIEWAQDNDPENLQIIDQPIHTEKLADIVKKEGFYIHYINTYSIWMKEPDYQVIVLKKSLNLKDYTLLPEKKITLISRIINKVKSGIGFDPVRLPTK